jgi:hypothetical protein
MKLYAAQYESERPNYPLLDAALKALGATWHTYDLKGGGRMWRVEDEDKLPAPIKGGVPHGRVVQVSDTKSVTFSPMSRHDVFAFAQVDEKFHKWVPHA